MPKEKEPVVSAPISPHVKCGKVDGEILKADTFYGLINGEFEEAQS